MATCTLLTLHSMMPSSRPNAPNGQEKKDIFRNMTATQASGQRSTISVHSAAAKVYTDLEVEGKQI